MSANNKSLVEAAPTQEWNINPRRRLLCHHRVGEEYENVICAIRFMPSSSLLFSSLPYCHGDCSPSRGFYRLWDNGLIGYSAARNWENNKSRLYERRTEQVEVK